MSAVNIRFQDSPLLTCRIPSQAKPNDVAVDVHDLNRLTAIEAACMQEHGGKYNEPECPICEALRLPITVDASEGRT